MNVDAGKLCWSCHGCQVVGECASTAPMARAFPPWEDSTADILSPLPSGESLLVLVDYFSGYCEVVILRSTSSTGSLKLGNQYFLCLKCRMHSRLTMGLNWYLKSLKPSLQGMG